MSDVTASLQASWPADAPTRDCIVRAARGWLGTPYHHHAALRGIGADCLGLVRGVWRDVYGSDPESPPPYTRDWAEASGQETMIAAAERHFQACDIGAARPGDVLLFRLRAGCVAKHAAILSGQDTFVHAMEGCVASEVALSPWWRRRIVRVFAFPGVTD